MTIFILEQTFDKNYCSFIIISHLQGSQNELTQLNLCYKCKTSKSIKD